MIITIPNMASPEHVWTVEEGGEYRKEPTLVHSTCKFTLTGEKEQPQHTTESEDILNALKKVLLTLTFLLQTWRTHTEAAEPQGLHLPGCPHEAPPPSPPHTSAVRGPCSRTSCPKQQQRSTPRTHNFLPPEWASFRGALFSQTPHPRAAEPRGVGFKDRLCRSPRFGISFLVTLFSTSGGWRGSLVWPKEGKCVPRGRPAVWRVLRVFFCWR